MTAPEPGHDFLGREHRYELVDGVLDLVEASPGCVCKDCARLRAKREAEATGHAVSDPTVAL